MLPRPGPADGVRCKLIAFHGVVSVVVRGSIPQSIPQLERNSTEMMRTTADNKGRRIMDLRIGMGTVRTG